MHRIDHRAQIQAERINFGRTINLHIALDCDKEDTVLVAQPLTFEPGGRYDSHPPCMSMYPDAAQQLMDELWRAGFRPTEGTGSAGSLAATERHLKDMQTIAFKLMDREHQQKRMVSDTDLFDELGRRPI